MKGNPKSDRQEFHYCVLYIIYIMYKMHQVRKTQYLVIYICFCDMKLQWKITTLHYIA